MHKLIQASKEGVDTLGSGVWGCGVAISYSAATAPPMPKVIDKMVLVKEHVVAA